MTDALLHQASADAAERVILASMFFAPEDVIAQVAGELRREDFGRNLHSWLFRTICDLHFAGLRGDLGLSLDTLRDEVKRSAFEWYDVSTVINADWAIGASFDANVALVKETAKKRAIRDACVTALREVQGGKRSQEIAGRLTAGVSNLAVVESKRSQEIAVVAKESLEKWDAMAAKGEDSFIPTGITKLDAMVGGILRDVLTVIAAPTSHGKTSLALSIAENVGHIARSHWVGLYSLEMSKSLITRRVLARESRIPMDRLLRWRWLSDDEKKTCREAAKELEGAKFHFASRCRSINEIVADARQQIAAGKLDVMIVDYLQLVEGMEGETREREVNLTAWKLFDLANETGIAVVALSQVLDACQQRKTGRLQLDDIRDAKAVGHHARAVWMFQRPWQWNKGVGAYAPQCQTLLQIEKQGEGRTGDVELHFDGEVQEFTDAPTRRCEHCGR